MASGAQAIVELLEAEGVEVCFGLPGVHNLALWEALRESSIRLVGVRHEQAAAYGADGYARASGQLGVGLVTTGPGAANTLAAVGEAWASRSPVLVIATDIPSGLRRPGTYRGVLHETTDQAGMFAPVTKATHRALSPELVAPAAAAAVAEAAAEPTRPVYLEIATDLLATELPDVARAAPDADAAKNYRVDCLLEGDAARVSAALAGRLPPRDALAGLARRLHEVRAQACASLDGRALRFLDAMRFALPDDAVVVADMCIPGYWLAGFHTPRAPRRLQVPLGWGTLGYAFPAALGAALAGRGPAVSLSGDGGFLSAAGAHAH